MAWYDLNDMPWLTKPGDPAGSLGKGIAAGSNLANTFLHGRQVRNQEDAQRAEMEMRAKAEPILMRAREQQIKLGELSIEKAYRAKEIELLQTKAEVEAGNLYIQAGQYPKGFADPQFKVDVGQWIKKYPNATNTKIFQMLNEGIGKADKSVADLERSGITAGGEISQTPILDENGNVIAYGVSRPGGRGLSIVKPQPDAKTPAKEQEILNQVADEERISGRTWGDVEKSKRSAELRLQTSLAKKSEMHFSYDENGRLQIDFGPGASTVGTQTKIQSELASLQSSAQQIDMAATTLREKDVGISGAVWEGINKWVSQIAPEVGDLSVSANRANVSRAVENYLSTQQAKGRLTAAERAEMRAALVSLSAGESFPRAEAVFKRMAKLQRMDAIAVAKSAKQPLQPWMFKGLEFSLDPDGQNDWRNLVQSGTLTKEEAAAWFEKANPGLVK